MRRTVDIDAAQSVLIDALQGETFAIHLITSIRNLRIKNVSPGQLYVFLMTQDQVGGRTVTWTPQVLNAMQPDPRPHSTTIQNFIANTGGILEASTPGSWK